MRESSVAAHGSAHPPRPGLWVCAIALCVLLTAFAPILSAQAQKTATGASTVFVSRLKAEPVDYQVKLTWVDSPDITGACLVYRGGEEITPQTISHARLIGSVNTGVGYFIDTPPDQSGVFYAVLLRDSAGTVYSLLIPFRNKTSLAVAPQSSAPEDQLAAAITDIKAVATAGGDAIEISFTSSNPGRDLLLFWATAPLLTSEDLARSTSATPLEPGTSRYVMAALPGLDYWFAVLDAGMFKLGQAPLKAGVNVTSQPVQLALTAAGAKPFLSTGSRRGIPLPSLALNRGIQTGEPISEANVPDFPREKAVSEATQKSISLILQGTARQAQPSRKPPQVLQTDATPTPGGELGRLQEIVQGPFLNGDMTGAQQGLLDYLSLPRKPDLRAHARFYLGQVYYIQGRSRDALLEFLTSQDYYFKESQSWIDACLERLEKEDR